MSVGFLVLDFTSMVDTVPLALLATKAVLPSGVIATPNGPVPVPMSVGFLVLVLTSIVDTVPPTALATKAVLPSGVTASWIGPPPTAMSVGFLVPVFASIVDTVSLMPLATKTVARHRPRGAATAADTPPGATPTSPPANPTTTSRRTHRNRRIAALPRYPHHRTIGRQGQGTSHSDLRTGRTGNHPKERHECRSKHRMARAQTAAAGDTILTNQSHITAGYERTLDAPEPAFRASTTTSAHVPFRTRPTTLDRDVPCAVTGERRQ